MSAQTDAMRASADTLENALMHPWTGDLPAAGMAGVTALRTAATNQDALVARLALLGITLNLQQ